MWRTKFRFNDNDMHQGYYHQKIVKIKIIADCCVVLQKGMVSLSGEAYGMTFLKESKVFFMS